MKKERALITCPVCKCDQYMYADNICNHRNENGKRCDGSGMSVKEAKKDSLNKS